MMQVAVVCIEQIAKKKMDKFITNENEAKCW
jgi:hypothetical protein